MDNQRRPTKKHGAGFDEALTIFADPLAWIFDDPDHIDYRQSKPNRFASGMTGDVVTVVLEPDVAKVFNSAEAVNRLLRAIISALPDWQPRPVVGRSRRKAR